MGSCPLILQFHAFLSMLRLLNGAILVVGFQFHKEKTNAALLGVASGFGVFFLLHWFFAGEHTIATIATALLSAIGLARLFVSMVDDKAQPKQKSQQDLEEAVQLSLIKFLEALDVDLSGDVRSTIWARSAKNDSLQMLTDYLPGNRPSAFNQQIRELHSSKGAAGCAYRTASLIIDLIEKPTSHDEYRMYLMRRWGFTRNDVQYTDPNRRGFVAVPIPDSKSQTSPRECIAVIFIDSTDPSVVSGLKKKDNIAKACKVASLLELPVKTLLQSRGVFV